MQETEDFKKFKQNLFHGWSKTMDRIYGADSKERHDGASWDKGDPSQWMEPYNEDLFREWSEFADSGVPDL